MKRDCYLEVPIASQTTNTIHQFTVFVERGDAKDNKPHKISHQLTIGWLYTSRNIYIYTYTCFLNVYLHIGKMYSLALLPQCSTLCFIVFKKGIPIGHFQPIINPSVALSGILHGVTFVLNISNLLGLSRSMYPCFYSLRKPIDRWSSIGWVWYVKI